ncbi:MAG: signal peptide peptidase SppA [Elainellaceae cyanobacterium]
MRDQTSSLHSFHSVMRDFLKSILATLIGLGLFTSLGAIGLLILLVSIVASTAETGPQVEQDSILTFDLSQEILDAAPSATPGEVIGALAAGNELARPMSLRSVLNALEQAAKDDRIVALYLRGSVNPTSASAGFATLREVRQALQKFQESGKPIYAYDDSQWQERDYYLTSVADTILQHPTSVLEINGLSSENIFFAGALEKFGIGVQVLRVGKYKAAVEPFTRRDNSPEAEEQIQTLVTDLWSEFLTSAAESRELTPQALQTIADQQALLLPEQAQAAGLVDKVAYEDEVATELQTLTGEAEAGGADTEEDLFRQISLIEYADAVVPEVNRSSRNQIAVIYAEGDIVGGLGGASRIGSVSLVDILREVRQDEDIKAVVLRVNSPGGSATASDQIAREVLLTKQEKPVIVSMGNYAASGGYQISAYADQIFASPNTITGSIGVFGLLPNVQELANQNGVTWDRVKTGRYADIDSISRPKTPEELALTQRVVDRIYEQFLTLVSESRDLPREQVAEVAQGRVWSGAEAQKIGLVDQLGGLDSAIQAAAEAASLGDDWQLTEYPRYPSLWVSFMNSHLNPVSTQTDPIAQELHKLQTELEVLRSMNDPLGVYNRLPFNPWIN